MDCSAELNCVIEEVVEHVSIPSQFLELKEITGLDESQYNVYTIDESGELLHSENSGVLGANINAATGIMGTVQPNNPYECLECGKSFASDISLRTHIRLHRQPTVCIQCDESFPTRHGYEHHLQEAHEKQHDWTCGECNLNFANRLALRKHRDEHHYIPNKPYECNLCDETFGHMVSLITHMRDHTGKKTLFQCWHCPEEFNDVGKMVMHMKRHFSNEVYDCLKCDLSFNTQEELNIHSKVHNGVKPFKCGVCGELFETLNEYRSHSQSHCKCTGCFRVFKTSTSCSKHMETCERIHGSSKPEKVVAAKKKRLENIPKQGKVYKCKGCQLEMDTKFRYESHIQTCGRYKTRLSKTKTLKGGIVISASASYNVIEEIISTTPITVNEPLIPASSIHFDGEELSVSASEVAETSMSATNNDHFSAGNIERITNRIHSGIDKYKNGIFFKCSYCNKNVVNYDQIMGHLGAHQYVPARTCLTCNCTFPNNQALDLHMYLQCVKPKQ